MTQKEYAASHKIVAFIFGDRQRAAAVNEELHDKGFYEAQGAIASTVVEVDDKGKTHVHEHGRGVKGSAVGMVVGGALGLLGGPSGVLLLAVAGAAIGGMAGRLGGRPIPTEDLGQLEAQLQPNTSALLILVARVSIVSASSMVMVLATPLPTLMVNWSPARTELWAVIRCESFMLSVPFGRPSRSSTLARSFPATARHPWLRPSLPLSCAICELTYHAPWITSARASALQLLGSRPIRRRERPCLPS